jgi:hypothetical protein
MRTPRELYHTTPIVCSCELDVCPKYGEPLKAAYVSGVNLPGHRPGHPVPFS